MGETGIKDVAQIVGPFLAAGALIWAVWSYRAKLRLDHYTEIDRIYADLVKLRITQPGLADLPRQNAEDGLSPEAAGDNASRYDAYAFLIWNFIETIHDRCKSDGKLLETWQPILDAEGKLHAEWLSRNLHLFKPGFRQWASHRIGGVSGFVGEDGEARLEA